MRSMATVDAMRISRNEPMARHTSWRVGGPADLYFRPRSRAELAAFLRELDPATPVHWMGLGSNLLVRDGGIRGAVIATAGCLAELHHLGDSLVEAGAGVPCTLLARQCARWQLGPAAFLAGIPGTVGGALTMNAGAFGDETWRHVAEVEVIDRQGAMRWRQPADYQVSYREVRGPAGEWFLGARLRFDPAQPTSLDAVRELIEQRQVKQPLGLPSGGSVFRNPPGDHAGRLIEAAGLKGLRVGGAEVSTKHANFIINTGTASAADIEALIGQVRRRVVEVHGIELVPEVHMLGEPAAAEGGL